MIWNYAKGKPTNRGVWCKCKGDHLASCAKRGYYVYAWFDKEGVFYIGKGTGGRYRRYHAIGGGPKPTKAQTRRERAKGHFWCCILVSGLSNRAAGTLKSELIHVLQPRCCSTGGTPRSPKEAAEFYQKYSEIRDYGKADREARSVFETLELVPNSPPEEGKSLTQWVLEREFRRLTKKEMAEKVRRWYNGKHDVLVAGS